MSAVWAEPVQEDELAGYAGAIFRPPRQSGETLRVTARFHRSPIAGLEAPGILDLGGVAFARSSPQFQTWRTVRVVRQYIKHADTAPVSVPDAAAYFTGAYLDLQDQATPHTLESSMSRRVVDLGGYNEAIAIQIRELRSGGEPVGSNEAYKDFLAADNMFAIEADHFGAAEAVVIRRPPEMFARFKAYLEKRGEDLPTGAQGWFEMGADWNPPLAAMLWPELKETPIKARSLYYGRAGTHATSILANAMIWMLPEHDVPATDPEDGYDPNDPRNWKRPPGDSLQRSRPPNGISLFTFDSLIGVAPNGVPLCGTRAFTHATGARFAAMIFAFHAQDQQKGEPPEAGNVAHECGHALFLPHRNPRTELDADPLSHDPADRMCVMGYSFPDVEHGLVLVNPDHFCGFCLLRLRGWDHQAIIRSEPFTP